MVVDASVVVRHRVPHDVHHAASRAWLVTWDAEQRDRAGRVIQVMVPEE